jgi:hypothetical protein
MPERERALWGLVVVVAVALLSAPALWNGFPLLQYDTGGYLARWYEGYLVPSRAVVYGLILNAGQWWNFWPVVVVQSALTVWVIALVLRAHGFGRPFVLLGVVVTLTFATTLPWLSAILLTDIFCGLGILGLYLLIARDTGLGRVERLGLIVLVAVAAATHSATLAVQVAMLLGAFALRFIRVRLRDGVIALALGVVLVFTANYAVSGRLAWTPGGTSIAFGRMLQDGIVKRYLDDHCPDRTLRLCDHRADLPTDADVWFWGSKLFDRLGRFAGLGAEMSRIALGSLVEYPRMQVETAAVAVARQLVAVRSGEGVHNGVWHSYAIIKRYTPWAAPAADATRQQRNAIDFDIINAVHYPIALLSLIMLPLLLTMRGAGWTPVRDLAAMMVIAVLANAAICGILSNPHDRYGARIVWLAGFIVALAALRLAADRRRLATERKSAAALMDPVTPPVR